MANPPPPPRPCSTTHGTPPRSRPLRAACPDRDLTPGATSTVWQRLSRHLPLGTTDFPTSQPVQSPISTTSPRHLSTPEDPASLSHAPRDAPRALHSVYSMRMTHPSTHLAAFAAAYVEYLHGLRAPQCFTAWCSPAVLNALPRRRPQRPTNLHRTGAVTPGSVRISLLDPSTAEGCVVLHTSQRVWVVLMRLRPHHGRWRIERLEHLPTT